VEEIKGTQIGKEEVKLSLCADIILCLKDPKTSTKKYFRHHKHFQKSSRILVRCQWFMPVILPT
jgi:hypothetical protein